MKQLTLEQHRARIEAIRAAADHCRRYYRRERIGEYLAGQCIYSLGDYPGKFSMAPTEYDVLAIRSLAESGVQLIQLHEEWNDAIRHFGADKFTSFDPKGLQAFVDLCHQYGIKVIPYISTGYFSKDDPDYRREFALSRYVLDSMHFRYAVCSAGSAAWREYLLPRTFAVLDTYGFDGIYNDWGYDGGAYAQAMAGAHGAPLREGEPVRYDPEEEDLLALIYTEVKTRGGVYKLHCDRNRQPPVKDRVYDYLWIGENVEDAAVGVGKDYPTYVVPCQDKQRRKEDADRYFAMTIPFLQFPLLTYGRPLLGANTHENIPYYRTDDPMGEYQFNCRVEAYMKQHPNGPYVYSLWSCIPDDPQDFPRWTRYFKIYRDMVSPGTVVYMELRDCADICSALPDGVYASMFVNECRYLAVSNLTGADYRLELTQPWLDQESRTAAREFVIPDGKMRFLRLDAETDAGSPEKARK